MPPSVPPSRPARQQKKPGAPRAAYGHDAPRALLLSLGVIFLGCCGPSSPLLQFSSPPPSSTIAPRFGFAMAEAFDAPTTAERTITEKWQAREEGGDEEEEGEDAPHRRYDGVFGGDGFNIGDGDQPLRVKRKLTPEVKGNAIEIDAPDLNLDSSSEPSVLLEGCMIPAEVTAVRAKHDKPTEGNVAENAVDGDASTWWARKGTSRWLEIEFDGGEDGDTEVEGVAVAFFRGHRRIAFFDMTLFDRNGKAVSKIKNIESGGQTQDFETFYFDEPVAGSRIRLDVKGTTAGQWNAVAEISACLHHIKTPAPVTPETEPPAPSGLTYVGCFMDDDTGNTRFLGDKRMQDAELTPLLCASFCSGYKYMGLQYSKDCFCGDTYYTSERDAIPTDQCNMPCSGDDELICGGPWANSIFIVGDPDKLTAEELKAINAPRVEDGIPRRKFTITNNCVDQIRLGATGGFVRALEDPSTESCPEGSVLDEAVGACFWGLPLPEGGKTYDIEPGEFVEIVLDNTAVNGVRWSGNMWAATGCHAKVGCETASCLRNRGFPDGFCPPSTGPTGPVTKAEFTLVDTGVDYYDVTAIDGVNLPVEMKPDGRSRPLERPEDNYWCSNPGGIDSMSENLDGCSWHFDATQIEGFMGQDMSSYLRWVRNDGMFANCEVDSDCDLIEGEGVGENLKCGLLFGQDALNGGVTEEMFAKKCGSSLGWHSPNGICGNSRKKPLGYFPNSFPFMCDVRTNQVEGDNSTQADLYGCAGKIYGLSGYSRNAEESACGCPDWVAEGINAPSESVCHSNNPFWDSLSLPWLKYLKRACPTAYCFPYDDHSSTFVCRNDDKNNDHEGKNSMSYIINFCPAETQASLLDW